MYNQLSNNSNYHKNRFKISAEMSNYLKDKTNTWLENYINNKTFKPSFDQSCNKSCNKHCYNINNSDLVKCQNDDSSFQNNYAMLPIVSFISFLFGYKFSSLLNKL